jgi:arylsulfatase A-like enzyme
MSMGRAAWAVRLVVAVGLAGAAAPATAGTEKPNIVYILADDLGWKDVGFHGSDIRTPNLDELAATGARLEQFYAQPMCTPTRAALMTGRYPMRYGLQTVVIPSAGTYGLPTDERTLPQALREAGYETAIVGKWHLGHAKREYWPKQRGFDHQYGPLLGEIDYFTQSAHGTRDWFREEVPSADSGYVTTLLGDEAVRLIRAHSGEKPLFLYLAFTAPHAPYQAPKEDLEAYASIADPARRAYAAMVSAMDREIGRVVGALDEKGMRGDTLIVFHSDNGGPRSSKFTGEVDTSKSAIPCDNGPYRDGKGMLYEGGTRVVSLANWTGHVAAGLVVNEVVHVVDMAPTLANLAGAQTGKGEPLGGVAGRGKPLDGLDVWPTISAGKPSPRTEVVYDVEPFRVAVRKGDWKLVWRTVLPSRVELFDVAKDPGETTNVADAHPEKVAELERWAEQLAGESAPPLFLQAASDVALRGLMSSVVLPEDAEAIEMQP